MGQAEYSILPADRAQANQGVGKVPKPVPTSLWDTSARKPENALCPEWPADKTESEIKLLIQENSKPQDLMTYYVRSKRIKDSKERYLSHSLHVIVI